MSLPVLAGSANSIDAYMAEVKRFPLLSRKDEYALALRYRDTGELDAAHELVTSNLRFVVKIAHEFSSYGVGLRDLIQEGNLGLMTAVKKYDPRKGTRLITYAVWWIKHFIQELIMKSRGFVNRGMKALKKSLFYKSTPATDDAPTDDAPPPIDLSLDRPISGTPITGTDDPGTTTHMDVLVDAEADQEGAVAMAQERAILKKSVSSALALLNERERSIVEKRTMAEEPESLQALGDEMGLTRERVRQIEASALKKLKKSLAS